MIATGLFIDYRIPIAILITKRIKNELVCPDTIEVKLHKMQARPKHNGLLTLSFNKPANMPDIE